MCKWDKVIEFVHLLLLSLNKISVQLGADVSPEQCYLRWEKTNLLTGYSLATCIHTHAF